ncbi:MAG: hypothetical protein CL471_17995 [Acidobacteria bacterium]|nr:hypothetical protein [Acidobacteriota bacterium]
MFSDESFAALPGSLLPSSRDSENSWTPALQLPDHKILQEPTDPEIYVLKLLVSRVDANQIACPLWPHWGFDRSATKVGVTIVGKELPDGAPTNFNSSVNTRVRSKKQVAVVEDKVVPLGITQPPGD